VCVGGVGSTGNTVKTKVNTFGVAEVGNVLEGVLDAALAFTDLRCGRNSIKVEHSQGHLLELFGPYVHLIYRRRKKGGTTCVDPEKMYQRS
jgi:hypothetical protein